MDEVVKETSYMALAIINDEAPANEHYINHENLT